MCGTFKLPAKIHVFEILKMFKPQNGIYEADPE